MYMTEQPVQFTIERKRIFGNFGLPRPGVPCVILSHGLESSKDGDKWLVLANRLYDAGIACLRFSYRGCGEGPEKSEGEFEDTTLSARIEDFGAAVEYVGRTGVDMKRLGVIGSSFGGMVALAAGAAAKAMVVMATPCGPTGEMGELLSRYRNGEFYELPSGRRLKVDIGRDLRQYDLHLAAARIRCPLLILHGSHDETVPVGAAYELYARAREPKRLEIVSGGNHSFDDPDHLRHAVDVTLEWFKQYL